MKILLIKLQEEVSYMNLKKIKLKNLKKLINQLITQKIFKIKNDL